MSQKNILVSGANGNLGSAVVEYFLKKGNQVIGLVHHKKEGDQQNNYEEYEVDLTDESATEKILKSILNKYSTIDTAVLTTGGFALGNIQKTGNKALRKQYALNFETAYHVTRPLSLHMEENKKGKIFFIGSEPGMDTTKAKGVVAYALAKSQLFQLANILNADTKKTGIQAHVVVPATIDTPQNRKSVPDADFSEWQKPADIAKIIGKYAVDYDLDNSEIMVEEEL